MTEFNPFAGTAQFYCYRPGIPSELTNLLVQAANRETTAAALLDVGTGTGTVIEALHSHFVDIIGVDPDGEMLAVAERKLRRVVAPETRLQLWRGRIEEFAVPPSWRASLVTFCRAFHWVDQPKVLRQLENLVADRGVIAVLSDRSFWEAGNVWQNALRDVIRSFLGKDRRAGEGVFSAHQRPYREIFRECRFSVIEEIEVPVKRTWSTENIFGYLYSTSFAAPSLFGDRLGRFEDEVRATLDAFSTNDRFHESNAFFVLLARRAS